MTERRVYDRSSLEQPVDQWNPRRVAQVIENYLKDSRTKISQEVGFVDGEVEVVDNVICVWLGGIETPAEYFGDVRKFLGPECRLIFERRVFGNREDGASIGSKPCIEFDTKAAAATLRFRTLWAFFQILLLICCIFCLLFFGSQLTAHWEGYDRPWTGLWHFWV